MSSVFAVHSKTFLAGSLMLSHDQFVRIRTSD